MGSRFGRMGEFDDEGNKGERTSKWGGGLSGEEGGEQSTGEGFEDVGDTCGAGWASG